MADVHKNWKHLVQEVLQRDQLWNVGQGLGRVPPVGMGLSTVVPPSLNKMTNIEAILQAINEIEDEDPTVAQILCEQAYGMGHELDPHNDGRGVLQFKTGLMSVIKQKGPRIDCECAIEHLWKFYQHHER